MYLGLDLSKSSTGWALWDGESPAPRFGHWRLGSEFSSDGMVFAKLHQNMADLHSLMPFSFIFAEEPINPGNLAGNTNIKTLRLASGLSAHVHSFGHAYSCRQVLEFNVGAWRPPFIGRINSDAAKKAARDAKKAGDPRASARKDLKALTVARCRQLGFNPRVDDEADAIGILTHGCLARGVTPPWLSDEVLVAELEVA